MTNPSSAFSGGSLCSGEAAASMSPSPERRSPDGGASDGLGSGGSDGLGSLGSLRYSPFSMDSRIPAPVRLDIDTDFQAVRQQEKEDIKVLNNQFVTLIEKVGTARGWGGGTDTARALGTRRDAATPGQAGNSRLITQLVIPSALTRLGSVPGLCLAPRGAPGARSSSTEAGGACTGGTMDWREALAPGAAKQPRAVTPTMVAAPIPTAKESWKLIPGNSSPSTLSSVEGRGPPTHSS